MKQATRYPNLQQLPKGRRPELKDVSKRLFRAWRRWDPSRPLLGAEYEKNLKIRWMVEQLIPGDWVNVLQSMGELAKSENRKENRW
jgi:hypothetical protein